MNNKDEKSNLKQKARIFRIISYFLKLVIVLSSGIGVGLCLRDTTESFMGGTTALLYFTIQSNIWIFATALVGILLMSLEDVSDKRLVTRSLAAVKLVFTVAITLTGVVFCFVLAPALGADPGTWSAANVLTHVICPVFAIADFFVFTSSKKLRFTDLFYVTIPPLYYLGFAGIGYNLGWDFGGGNNFPYFFLNWDSPAGVFGFSKQMPYFMGTFYWVLVLLAFVLGVGALYIFGARRIYAANFELLDKPFEDDQTSRSEEEETEREEEKTECKEQEFESEESQSEEGYPGEETRSESEDAVGEEAQQDEENMDRGEGLSETEGQADVEESGTSKGEETKPEQLSE